MDQPPPVTPDQPTEHPPAASPVAPPTQPYAPPPPPPKSPTWVRAIGIIAIVIGSLNAAGGLCGAAMPLVISPFLERIGSNVSDVNPTGAMMEKWKTTIILGQLIGAALGVFLIFGASKLLKCRHGSPKLLMTWAGASLAFIIVNTVMNYGMQVEQIDEMRRQAAGTPAAMGMEVGLYAGLVIGLVWGLTLPVFILIWFSRAKIKAEVAQWT